MICNICGNYNPDNSHNCSVCGNGINVNSNVSNYNQPYAYNNINPNYMDNSYGQTLPVRNNRNIKVGIAAIIGAIVVVFLVTFIMLSKSNINGYYTTTITLHGYDYHIYMYIDGDKVTYFNTAEQYFEGKIVRNKSLWKVQVASTNMSVYEFNLYKSGSYLCLNAPSVPTWTIAEFSKCSRSKFLGDAAHNFNTSEEKILETIKYGF